MGYGLRTCLKVRAARISEFYSHGVRMMSLTQGFVARLQSNAKYVPVWEEDRCVQRYIETHLEKRRSPTLSCWGHGVGWEELTYPSRSLCELVCVR